MYVVQFELDFLFSLLLHCPLYQHHNSTLMDKWLPSSITDEVLIVYYLLKQDNISWCDFYTTLE